VVPSFSVVEACRYPTEWGSTDGVSGISFKSRMGPNYFVGNQRRVRLKFLKLSLSQQQQISKCCHPLVYTRLTTGILEGETDGLYFTVLSMNGIIVNL
jgi:hypothetical protein